jgi:hypothetical protein
MHQPRVVARSSTSAAGAAGSVPSPTMRRRGLFSAVALVAAGGCSLFHIHVLFGTKLWYVHALLSGSVVARTAP